MVEIQQPFFQLAFIVVAAAAVGCFAAWRYFSGGAWWIAVAIALIAYTAILSAFFLGAQDAWQNRVIQFVFDFMLSNSLRAGVSLTVLLGVTVWLGILAYKARPADSTYYEVRVFENVNLPSNYHVGAKVTIHSRTDGLTHTETVAEDGAAVFRTLTVPTTLSYQLEIVQIPLPFMTGGFDEIISLPQQLIIDTSEIPSEKREPLTTGFLGRSLVTLPRTPEYLIDVDERGDKILQVGNSPWGVPRADLVINRLGYVLGYDLTRKLPSWVAYSVGPSEQRVPRPDRFFIDPAIAIDKQARVSDYRGSGYDRGHMISPADLSFKGPITVQEAFYMSTVTPQTPWLNRRMWRELEEKVRDTVQSRQRPVYVIAGPLFVELHEESNPEFLTIGESRIPVPTHFFRIMAIESLGGELEAFGVIMPNTNDGSLELTNYLVSIDEIEQKSELTFFPLLTSLSMESIKAEIGALW